MAGSFAMDLTRFCQKADLDLKTVIRKITLEAFKRIISRTPVDTGMARGNWIVSAGAPVTFQVTAGDKSGSATLTAATNGTLSWSCQGSLFMVNNLPYIGTLEYGSSTQAPGGMVRLTLAEMQAWAASAVNSKESMSSIRGATS